MTFGFSTGDLRNSSNLSKALLDLRSGLFGTFVWLHLAWQDTKQRYRRSIIGPFWITISTGIMVLAMGPLYGALLKQEIGPYIQHLAVSLIVWMFISGVINESCSAFIGAAGYIKEIKLPLFVHVLRVLAKNLIMLAHNSVIVLLVLIAYPPTRGGVVGLAIIGLVVVIGNLLWIGLVTALLCARFRDIPQIVTNVVQVAFFISPILWKADMLGSNKFVADLNPLYHLVDVIRAPLLGQLPANLSWFVVFGMLIAGSVFALCLFSRFRSRVAYWI